MKSLLALLFSTLWIAAQPANQSLLESTSSLRNNLVASWSLNETSGIRYDLGRNGYYLNSSGGVGSAVGVVGNCATFVSASSQYLSRTNLTLTGVGANSYEWTCWVRLASKPANAMSFYSKWQSDTSNDREYSLLWNNATDRFAFNASSNGVSTVTAVANTFGAPATNVWYFVDVYYNQPAAQLGISVNGGAFDTATLPGLIYNSGASFKIGTIQNGNTPLLNGAVDEMAIWSRLLTTAERTRLYSSGLGAHFPFSFIYAAPSLSTLHAYTAGSQTDAFMDTALIDSSAT